MKIGQRSFDTDHQTYIMGILNVTPDSFSDGSCWNGIDAALRHTEQMIHDGADLIDIGGESTRPGFVPVPAEEEIERVAPVLRALKDRFDIPVSVDTYKPDVADVCLSMGADMINDIWGLRYDKKMAEIIARYQTVCCLMHNRKEAVYHDFQTEWISDIHESIRIARNAGIPEEHIIIDPGIGFGKTYEMNLLALKNLHTFCGLGYPVLLGCSRKSVIGHTLGLPVDQRLEGTLVTTVKAVMCGCAFVRVHDVKENKRALDMARAIL